METPAQGRRHNRTNTCARAKGTKNDTLIATTRLAAKTKYEYHPKCWMKYARKMNIHK